MPAPYEQVPSDELILRDRLAADRTLLANERTLLAYVRSAFGAFVAGVTFIQLFDSMLMRVIGTAFLPISAAVLVIGILRFRRFNRDIAPLVRQYEKQHRE